MLPIRICCFSLALAACHAGAQPPAPGPLDAGSPMPFGVPLDDASLADLRGGTDTTVNDMRLNGTTAANTAIDVLTGTNTIGTGAFSAMSGIPIVIQNTGANVLIQNAVILNLQVQ